MRHKKFEWRSSYGFLCLISRERLSQLPELAPKANRKALSYSGIIICWSLNEKNGVRFCSYLPVLETESQKQRKHGKMLVLYAERKNVRSSVNTAVDGGVSRGVHFEKKVLWKESGSGCATEALYETQIHLPIEYRNSTSNLLIRKTLVVCLLPRNILAFLTIITDRSPLEFCLQNEAQTPDFEKMPKKGGCWWPLKPVLWMLSWVPTSGQNP